MTKILLIDDDSNLRFAFKRMLDPERFLVDEAGDGQAALNLLKPGVYSAVFLDLRMPGPSGMEVLDKIRQIDPKVPVVMITAYGGTEEAIEAVQRGAYDFVLKPFDVEHLRRLTEQAVHAYTLMTRKVEVNVPAADGIDSDTLVGRSRVMQEVYKQIGRVASSDATVLILGASGTGKELVARAIYQHSPRSGAPFLAVNCAAIPEGLLESDLFGHEKGAFTSADHRRLGKFERARGGTLFLDEIGDMSPGTQAKILRVLQDGTMERVGGNAPLAVDVRILAATNRDLPQLIQEGRFREDLYFRLNVFSITLPTLEQRRDDLPLLVQHCLSTGNRRLHKHVTDIPLETMEKLQAHTWRGNVRELENVIQRALIVTSGTTLLPESIQFADDREGPTPDAPGLEQLMDALFSQLRRRGEATGETVLGILEENMLKRALDATGGNQLQAARIVGLSRQTLRKRLGERESASDTEAE